MKLLSLWKNANGITEVRFYILWSSGLKIYDLGSVFGFAAALLEGLPIIGLVFTISNRIGAAMWAHGQTHVTLVASVIPDNVLSLRS